MKKIPLRPEKMEWLCDFLKYCPGSHVRFYKQIDFNKIRLVYPWTAGLNDSDILAKFQIDMHHRCSDSDINIGKYPLFIHSILNILPLFHSFHLENHSFWSITDEEAAAKEKFLENEPDIARFVNTLQGDHGVEEIVKNMLRQSYEEDEDGNKIHTRIDNLLHYHDFLASL